MKVKQMTMRTGFRLTHLVLLIASAPTAVAALVVPTLKVQVPVADSSEMREEAITTARGDSRLPPTTDHRDTYFLGIGINEYEDGGWKDLDGAVPDVDGLAAILGEQYDVVIDEKYLLRNGAASRDSINKILTEFLSHLKNMASAGDTANAIFYFAGHGYVANDDDPITKGSVFLIPADGGGTPTDDEDVEAIMRLPRGLLANQLKWIWLGGILDEFALAKSVKQIMVIVDACDAGSERVAVISERKRNEGREDVARELMTAAGAARPAIEREGEGVFTGRLIEALEALAVESDDGIVFSNQVWDQTIGLLQDFKQRFADIENAGDPLLGDFLPIGGSSRENDEQRRREDDEQRRWENNEQWSKFMFRVRGYEERKDAAESFHGAVLLAKTFDEIWLAWSRGNPVSERCVNVNFEMDANGRNGDLEETDAIGDPRIEATIRRWGIAFMCGEAMGLELPTLLSCDVAKRDRDRRISIMGWGEVEERYGGAYCETTEVQR